MELLISWGLARIEEADPVAVVLFVGLLFLWWNLRKHEMGCERRWLAEAKRQEEEAKLTAEARAALADQINTGLLKVEGALKEGSSLFREHAERISRLDERTTKT